MSVTVQASKHPLKPDWVYADVEAGQSIYEIAAGAPVAAYLNGREVPEELHRLTRVKDGAHLTLWPIPQDDNILRSAALIAVSIAAGPAAAAILPAGASAFAVKAATLGIGLIGSMAINALIPPQTPDFDTNSPESFNRLQALTGASNRVAAFRPIPRLYGTFKYFPPTPMTAKPFTEVVGSDQYLRMLVCLGYGPLEIGGQTVGEGYPVVTEQTSISGSPITIGDTDINLFDDVEWELGSPDQISLYTNQIIETNAAFTTSNDQFEGIDDDGTVTKQDGESAIRTTDTDADEISIDIVGALYSVNKDAKTTGATVDFKIEYREVGTTTWIVQEETFSVFSAKKETIRRGYRWKVPTGQYEVRLTRKQTTHSNTSAVQNELTWNALRTVRSVRAFDEDGTVVMALRIRATDQLNGQIDNLAVKATSVLDVWNGSAWVPEPTDNPAWIYADIWSGTANRRPVPKDDLDIVSLVNWASYCEDNEFTYNSVVDNRTTTLEIAQEVAAAGLASWAFLPDSKIGVVQDVVQSIPKMIISPRNSFNFGFETSAIDLPEALRVQFVDPDTYENTERLVFDDGFSESNAQKYESIQAKGVTDPDQAWKYGRYHLAQQRLRPERFNFSQDVQHLRYKRGDLLTIQHDVILVGLFSGRVVDLELDQAGFATQLTLDERIEGIDLTKQYGVKIQRKDGSIATSTINLIFSETEVTQAEDYGQITGSITDQEDWGLLTQGSTDFDNYGNIISDTFGIELNSPLANIEKDDLVIFGEVGRESIDVKVTEIQPQGDFIAQVTCVPASDNILDAITGNIPAYDPVITEPVDPSNVVPQVPIIDSPSIRAGATSVSSVSRDGEGSPSVSLYVSIAPVAQFGAGVETQVRFREQGTSNWTVLEPQSGSVVRIDDINVGTTYEIQSRGVNGPVFSDWSNTVLYSLEDESSLASGEPVINNLSQVDEQLPPIGTVQSYVIVDFSLSDTGATPSIVEVTWESSSVSPLTETYDSETSIVRVPVNTYGETYSFRVRAKSVHGYWSEYSDPETIIPADPNVSNGDLIDFISGSISESELTTDLTTRLDDFGLEITELEDQYTVKIDNNGGVAGFGLANTANDDTGDPSFSEFYVNADRFAILPQGGTIGVDDTSPFIVQNNQVFIDNAVIANGSIDNAKIGDFIQSDNYVAGTSGWKVDKTGSAEFNDGTFRGQLDVKSSDTGARTEISDEVIKVFDSNGVLRVKIGNLSL